MSKDQAVMFGCVGVFVSSLIIVIFQGLVLSQLWLWFVVPLGLPHIGVAQAIGITMIVSYLAKESKLGKESPTQEAWVRQMIYSVCYSVMLLGLGYIIHLFTGIPG